MEGIENHKSFKLALGTAQFGFTYGVSNKTGQVQPDEVCKILNLAKQAGVDTIDTAIAYGSCEAVIGAVGLDRLKVVTKLPSIPSNLSDVRGWIRLQVNSSLARLNVVKVYGLLLHRSQNLIGKEGIQVVSALEELKTEGVVQKIGISIYSPDELDEILKKVQIDLVQAPVNVIDRRMQLSGWLDRLGDDGVEVHARSVFLQGLLLMKRSEIPQKFMRWSHLWDQWKEQLKDKSVSPLAACLAYPLLLPQVNQVIVGVDSVAQFSEIIRASQLVGDVLDTSFMQSSDLDLVNPSNWNNL